jgi:heme/copper-type cytochrome/quinol oxidase subunit 3
VSDRTQAQATPRLVETPEEIEYELRATEGALWTGTRLLIGAVGFAFASLAFAYFYLRSSNSEDLWRPHGETAPMALGTAIFALTVGAAALLYIGNLRRRQGTNVDWLVAGWTVVVLGLLTVALQILELTRLSFYPGSSGYASCLVAWAVMNIALLLGSIYWIETLLARSARLRRAMVQEGATPGGLPADRIYHASAEGCVVFWGFAAFISALFWVSFYVI